MHAAELRWILDLALMIGAARVAGEVFRRLGLSAVIGEILVGVLLGAGALGGTALAVALAGVVVPFAAGYGVAQMPSSRSGSRSCRPRWVASLGLALLLTAVAIATKLVGCALPARSAGMGWCEGASTSSAGASAARATSWPRGRRTS